MEISTERYIVTRNNHKEVFCGTYDTGDFIPIEKAEATKIRHWESKRRAQIQFGHACRWRWMYSDPEIEVLPVKNYIFNSK